MDNPDEGVCDVLQARLHQAAAERHRTYVLRDTLANEIAGIERARAMPSGHLLTGLEHAERDLHIAEEALLQALRTLTIAEDVRARAKRQHDDAT